MSETSPADARLAIMRLIRALFMEILATEDAGPEGLESDAIIAEELSLELLDVLGLEVLEVHENNTITVLLSPESL